MRKIVCVLLVLSMLVVSVSAADVYDIEPDTVILKSPASSFSSGVSPLATGSDYSQDIYNWLGTTLIDMLTRFNDYFINMDDTLLDILTSINSSNSALSTISGSLSTSNYWLQQIWSSLSDYATEDTLSSLSDKVATDKTLNTVNSSVQSLKDSVNTQFNSLVLPTGSPIMGPDGTIVNSWDNWSLETIMQYGLIGIQRLFSGYSDNSYSGTIYTNNLDGVSFTTNGLGHLLGSYLSPLQLNLAQLSYIFASPADIQAKKDSESLTGQLTDSFLKPDSKASIKLSDVGVLKDSSEVVQDLGQTGVTPGQAFSQLTGNSDLFSFFSEETAADLNTVPTVYSRDPGTQIVTDYYNQSRSEFYELIGKGGDE